MAFGWSLMAGSSRRSAYGIEEGDPVVVSSWRNEAVTRRLDSTGEPGVDAISTGTHGTALHVFDHSFPKSDGYAFRSGEIIRFLRRSGWRTSQITSAKHGPSAAPREPADGPAFYPP